MPCNDPVLIGIILIKIILNDYQTFWPTDFMGWGHSENGRSDAVVVTSAVVSYIH